MFLWNIYKSMFVELQILKKLRNSEAWVVQEKD